MGLRAAVTGFSGFVGRHLVNALRSFHTEVVEVHRSAGNSGRASEDGVSLDLSAPPANIYKALREPDMLVHLAWGRLSDYRSLHHIELELPLHFRFLKAAVEAGVPKVLVTGTCLEYGLQIGALAESAEPEPVTAYGFAKDALRRQLQFLQRSVPFNLTWARLFYLYGPGQRSTSLVPSIESAARDGASTFEISRDDQTRDYLKVETAARYLARLAILGGDFGVVNVCSGRGVRVEDFVKDYIAEHGWSMNVIAGSRSSPDYEPRAFWGDRTKLDSIIGEERR